MAAVVGASGFYYRWLLLIFTRVLGQILVRLYLGYTRDSIHATAVVPIPVLLHWQWCTSRLSHGPSLKGSPVRSLKALR